MENQIRNFKFPEWSQIQEGNRCFLDRGEYKGYSLQIPVHDNLYLLIDCQNEAVVLENGENAIRFAWCTNNGFAISSVRYAFCEAGYLMGCAHLVNAAAVFSRKFEEFAKSNVHIVRKRIERYELAHPLADPGKRDGDNV